MTLIEYAEQQGAEVLVLTKPNCRQCTATKNRLTNLGVGYTEDLLGAMTIPLAQKEHFSSAPIVVVPGRGEAWCGFRPDRIDALA